jgi:hypothetical protein
LPREAEKNINPRRNPSQCCEKFSPQLRGEEEEKVG